MSLPRPTQVSAIHTQVERFELTRPYAISFRAMMDHVENVVVRLETADGHVGHGAACPEHFVTGETNEACRAALADDRLEWLIGQDVRTLSRLCRELGERLPAAPAARAALDIALHDLYAQHLELPLVEVLGRAHTRLQTGRRPAAWWSSGRGSPSAARRADSRTDRAGCRPRGARG